MTLDIHNDCAASTDIPAHDAAQGEQPARFNLNVDLDDPESIAAIVAYPEGRDRSRFVRTALRIGILALNQAQGRIDSEAIKNEGDKLVRDIEDRLANYRRQTEEQLATTLKEYFDPQNGRFNERVERLVRQDGELERLMRQQMEVAERTLADTLTRHIGADSVLMQYLEPGESNRFLNSLREHVEQTFASQADAILREFSLDNTQGALTRLVRELKDKHGETADGLKAKIGEVVQEFSLDNEQSALSRLVRRVESAQKQISNEFSLDAENSALARMKRELTQMIEAQNRAAQEFQTQVVSALDAMRARKAAEAVSTTHGHDFQQAGFEILQDLATRGGDIAEDTGSSTGLIPRSKVGDAVITLGADNAAAGARIAVEFKEDASYTLKATLDEIDIARKNRDAGVGLFVHSRRTAPAGLETLARHGNDIVVVWDTDDEASDAYLRAGFMAAKALAVRARLENAERAADFQAIDKSLHEIQRQVAHLEQIKTWTTTIKNNADNVIGRVTKMQEALGNELEKLTEQIDQLKSET